MVKKSLIHFKQADLGYHKNKKDLVVLENLNLEFCEGDFIGLVGLNGVGKSTLIKSLSAELSLLKGEVLLEQINIFQYSLSELSKKIALVLTERVRGFNLTVFDLVSSGQMPYTNWFHHLNKSHIEIINQAMEKTGVLPYAQKSIHELSDGNFQKALIAKALAQQTQTILLDEPGAFLDYGSKHRLFEWLQKLTNEQNKLVLASSHDLHLVGKYCNKILILFEGKAELLEAKAAMAHPAFLEIGGTYL